MRARYILLFGVLILLLVFVLQNTQPLTVKFLFWEALTSGAVTILISFLAGALLGWLVAILKPKGKKETSFPPSAGKGMAGA